MQREGSTFVGKRKNYGPKNKAPLKKSVAKTTGGEKVLRLEKQLLVLRNQVKGNEPPIKSIYQENILSPQNEGAPLGIPYPALGGAKTNRLGQDIKLKSINIRGLWKVAESDGFDNVRLTIIQYMDKNANAGYPFGSVSAAWNNVFLEDYANDYPIIAPFNTQTTQSYRVLYDETWCLSSQGIEGAMVNIVLTPKDFAVKKLHFNDDASNANLPGLQEGLIMGWVSSDSAASPNPSFTYTVKTNFIDT